MSETKFQFIEKCGEYTVYRCPACDVMFSDPMKNPGSDWYEKSEMYAVGKFLHTRAGWHHNQFLKDPKIYGKKLLDVGCGPGAFLNEAKKKGYEVWGLDFDGGNVKVAKERYGIENVYIKSVEEASRDFAGQRFDVVTLFEVLEHLDDPVRFMAQVKDILSQEGYIVVSLPNRDRFLDTLGEGDNPPNHLTRWTLNSLSTFLERNGFSVVKSVAKRLNAEEVGGYFKARIRLGIAKKHARAGIENNKKDEIRKAAFLMKCKDMIFGTMTFPLAPLLFVLSLQGTGLYVIAKVKK